MDKSYNFNLPIKYNINSEQNKNIISINESPKISLERNDKTNNINFNHKKRRRGEFEPNNDEIRNINLNPLEKKFLSFQEFSNKIIKEIKNHKIKRKDFFNNNKISMFNPSNSNSNNILLLDANININNTLVKEDNNKNLTSNNSSNNYILNDTNKNKNNDDKNYSYKRQNSNNYINSSQQKIIVSASSSINKKENDIIGFDNFGNNITINDIKSFPIYKNRKKYIRQVSISLVVGVIILCFVYFIVDGNHKNEIKYVLNCFSIFSWIIILCFILIFIIIIIIFIYYKKNENSLYNKIAFEDFEILKKLLYKIYFDNKDENAGLFQTQFIQDCSNKRVMEEKKYIKYVLPIINKFIEKFNYKHKENQNKTTDGIHDMQHNFVIKEFDFMISGQKKKLWRYIKYN